MKPAPPTGRHGSCNHNQDLAQAGLDPSGENTSHTPHPLQGLHAQQAGLSLTSLTKTLQAAIAISRGISICSECLLRSMLSTAHCCRSLSLASSWPRPAWTLVVRQSRAFLRDIRNHRLLHYQHTSLAGMAQTHHDSDPKGRSGSFSITPTCSECLMIYGMLHC